MTLGRLGVWSPGLRVAELASARDAAAELESLGYGTLWLPGRDPGVFERAGALLAATERVVVATGIASIWAYTPAGAAEATARLRDEHGARFLLGLGVSHGPVVESRGLGRYEKPLERMRDFLDGLDAAPRPVPEGERILAALAPGMLRLAAERSLGTHTYLATPTHTGWARELLGAGPLLAPEQGAVLERDPAAARAIARAHLTQPYTQLPNYRRTWLREGFTEEEIDTAGDRFVDATVAWGDEAAIARRVQDHVAAGADHVCLQLLTGDPAALPLAEWRALAPVSG